MTAILPARQAKEVPPDPNPGPHLKIRPMEEVLAMRAGDASSWQQDRTVRGMLEYKRDHQYRQLMVRIPRDGFEAGYGVSIYVGHDDEEYLSNGHHRVTALHDLGAKWVPVRNGIDDVSSWQDHEGYDRYDYSYGEDS